MWTHDRKWCHPLSVGTAVRGRGLFCRRKLIGRWWRFWAGSEQSGILRHTPVQCDSSEHVTDNLPQREQQTSASNSEENCPSVMCCYVVANEYIKWSNMRVINSVVQCFLSLSVYAAVFYPDSSTPQRKEAIHTHTRFHDEWGMSALFAKGIMETHTQSTTHYLNIHTTSPDLWGSDHQSL